MWEAVERYHQLCYWAPEVREEGAKAGLKGFWMNYFASRAAPLGPVSAATVQALFFYYSSDRVKRAIPDAWNYASPERSFWPVIELWIEHLDGNSIRLLHQKLSKQLRK